MRPPLWHPPIELSMTEHIIDRVIVNDGQVEIRYVVPTGPQGETTPFCHLRLDYLSGKGLARWW